MSKINIQIYKPFGSSISMQDLPFELMKDFREDLKMIQELPEEKKKNYWFGYKLAGGLGNEGEFLITPEAKLLNQNREALMEHFGILKSGSAGIIKNNSINYSINGPLDLIEKVLEIGKSLDHCLL